MLFQSIKIQEMAIWDIKSIKKMSKAIYSIGSTLLHWKWWFSIPSAGYFSSQNYIISIVAVVQIKQKYTVSDSCARYRSMPMTSSYDVKEKYYSVAPVNMKLYLLQSFFFGLLFLVTLKIVQTMIKSPLANSKPFALHQVRCIQTVHFKCTSKWWNSFYSCSIQSGCLRPRYFCTFCFHRKLYFQYLH